MKIFSGILFLFRTYYFLLRRISNLVLNSSVYLFSVSLFFSCASNDNPSLAGTGTSSETVALVFKVQSPSGLPLDQARGVLRVRYSGGLEDLALRQSHSNSPVTLNSQDSFVSLTNPQGLLRFDSIPYGAYQLIVQSGLVSDANGATTISQATIPVIASANSASQATQLLKTARTGKLSLKIKGRIPGELIFAWLDGLNTSKISDSAGIIDFDSLAPGEIRVLLLGKQSLQGHRFSVLIHSESTERIENLALDSFGSENISNWQYHQKLSLDQLWIAQQGVMLSELGENPISVTLPILLNTALVKKTAFFTQTELNGADIRLTIGNRFIPYEIENWNNETKNALLWVQLDSTFIKGMANSASKSDSLVIHWGNSFATNFSGAVSPFSLSQGYRAVWHFSNWIHGIDGLPEISATNSENTNTISTAIHSTPSSARSGCFLNAMDAPSLNNGPLSQSVTLPILNAGLECNQSQSSGLQLQGKGTISFWFKPDDLSVNRYQRLVSTKTSWSDTLGYEVEFNPRLQGGELGLLGSTFYFARLWKLENPPFIFDTTSAWSSTWYHCAMVFNDSLGLLYLDGGKKTDDSSIIPILSSTNAFRVGQNANSVQLKELFNGSLDELRVEDKTKTSNQIRFDYITQKYPEKLWLWE